jgi:hypothetical protein
MVWLSVCLPTFCSKRINIGRGGNQFCLYDFVVETKYVEGRFNKVTFIVVISSSSIMSSALLSQTVTVIFTTTQSSIVGSHFRNVDLTETGFPAD